MKVIYDPEVHVLRIIFKKTNVFESDEDKLGVIIDCDKKGNLVRIEAFSSVFLAMTLGAVDPMPDV